MKLSFKDIIVGNLYKMYYANTLIKSDKVGLMIFDLKTFGNPIFPSESIGTIFDKEIFLYVKDMGNSCSVILYKDIIGFLLLDQPCWKYEKI